jgi:LysM repeat protein
MRTRAWGLLVAIVILAAAIVTVFYVWRKAAAPASPSPTSTAAPTSQSVVAQATAIPSQQPTDTPTPAPFVYIVQEGDTLSAIAQRFGVTVDEIVAANNLANPDVLSIGQAIVIPKHFVTPTISASTATTAATAIPESQPTPGASPGGPAAPLPTLTPSGPPVVEIGVVLGAGNLMEEIAVVRNRGGVANLEGWTLSDAEGNSFAFPAIIIFDKAEVRVHSPAGSSTPADLYWGRTSPAWSSGELITLRDAVGNTVSTYIVP